MRIIHTGGFSSPRVVDGINSVIWTTAVEQARLGHEVCLLVSEPPDDAARDVATTSGIDVDYVSASRWRFDPAGVRRLLDGHRPDIVHFHSVFIPRQATLARALRRRDIPYVVTPHGGLMPQVFERGRLKKAVYSKLVEQTRIRHAGGIAYVTPGGEEAIADFVPGYSGVLRWVPNPVDVDALQRHRWRAGSARPRLIFLGRYDVYHKGLDRLAEIARRVPEADFHLYGAPDPDTLRYLDVLRRHGPPNFQVNDPVFGAEKLETLSSATMYMQVSRWEALSMSILEALALGTPCVIAESMSMAAMFATHDLGAVVSANPVVAAKQLTELLKNRSRLEAWSKRSREYARDQFSPESVACQIIEVYQEVLARRSFRSRGAGIDLDR